MTTNGTILFHLILSLFLYLLMSAVFCMGFIFSSNMQIHVLLLIWVVTFRFCKSIPQPFPFWDYQGQGNQYLEEYFLISLPCPVS